LLRQEGIPQIGCPLDIAGHSLHYIWEHYQPLHARIPRLFCHGVCQRFAA
jgi:hypothetical protein